MSVMRALLLAGSESRWLREQAPRYPFVRRTVTRFMPGESLEDALEAAKGLQQAQLSTIITQLGENVADEAEAEAVAQHYVQAIDRIREAGLDTLVSLKLTHLGLDLETEIAVRHLKTVVAHAAPLGHLVWIDMEGRAYTEVTLDIYKRLRAEHANVGICLQAYLHRTAADLESLIPMGAAVRLVKGAYKEPPDHAIQRKIEVDENYFTLATRLLSDQALRAGVWTGIGTHDLTLIRRIRDHLVARGLPKDCMEFEMLYGIQRAEQVRLAREGYLARVLISYGSYWFPWFMRRLAERPANVMFLAKHLFGGGRRRSAQR